MITACSSRAASGALRSSLQHQSRRYLEVNGAPPSKASQSRLFSTAGIAVALVAGGAAYLAYGTNGADPRKLKETEDRLKEKLGMQKTDAGAAPERKGALGKEFRNFKLESVTPYNHDSSTFKFKLPEGEDSGLTVASALLTRAADEKALLDDKAKPVIRPYTPVTAPNEKGYIELLVKNYDGGKMSSHIHSLKPGQELAMKGPIPKHSWKPNEFETVAFLMGGSGVTPGWQVVQAIAADPTDRTKVVFLNAHKTPADVLLRKELDQLAKDRPDQFKIVHVVDKPDSKAWKGETGHLTADVLKKYLPLPGLADKIKLFVCGPPGMVEAIAGNKKSPKDQGPLKGALARKGCSTEAAEVYKF